MTATRTCNNGNHPETETVSATYGVVTAAQCGTAGTGRWTSAAFTNEAFEAQTKDVDIPALVHDWNTPTYTWADDNSTCTATRTCNNGDHPETEMVAATPQATPATECTGYGSVKYTAVFTNDAFATQTKEVIDSEALGHDWGEWVVTLEPTCENGGSKYHICSRCSTTEEAEIEKLGHDLAFVPGEYATCQHAGTIDSYHCGRCGKDFLDVDGTTVVDSVVDPIREHNFSDPLCPLRNDNDRVTHSYYCVYGCGTRGQKERHTFDQETIAREYQRSPATCTEAATYYKSCRCGEKGSTTFEVGAPLGHDLKDVEGRAATCTVDGYTAHQACTRCSYTENYERLPATGHGTYAYDASKSGASADGSLTWKAYSCEKGCGDYYMKLTVKALDRNGNPIPDVDVTITDGSGKVFATGRTGSDGVFNPATSFQQGSYIFSLTYKNSTKNERVTLWGGTASGSIGQFTNVSVSGSSDSGSGSGSGSGSDSGSSGNVCKYCGQVHTGTFGWLIQLFHTILAFFKR